MANDYYCASCMIYLDVVSVEWDWDDEYPENDTPFCPECGRQIWEAEDV